MSIRVGILGYGNLGRGVECAVKQNDDMELAAVFTRRDPSGVTILTEGVPVCSVDDAADWKDKIDVLILCGGCATDLRNRRRSLHSCLMYLTVLTHMPAFRSILRMWMLRRRRVEKSELFP